LALPSPYGQSGQYDQNGWSGQDGQDGHYDFFGEAHPGNGAGSSGQTDPHLALDPPASASYRELGDDVGPEPYLPPQPYRQREPSADNGSYGPADGYGSTGSGAGPDALNGHRAFGSDSLGRASSFGPADSFGPAGSFGPADAVGQAGSFDPASSYGPASSYDQVGSDDPAYGTFGRPGSDVDGGPSGRRGRQDARSAGRGQSPASAGYSAWHDDREDSSDSEGHGDDDDWDDDSSSGSGLLSRFGRGGGGKIGRGRGRGGRGNNSKGCCKEPTPLECLENGPHARFGGESGGQQMVAGRNMTIPKPAGNQHIFGLAENRGDVGQISSGLCSFPVGVHH